MINTEQAETVKEIFNGFLSGTSLEQLKEKLEAGGRKAAVPDGRRLLFSGSFQTSSTPRMLYRVSPPRLT